MKSEGEFESSQLHVFFLLWVVDLVPVAMTGTKDPSFSTGQLVPVASIGTK